MLFRSDDFGGMGISYGVGSTRRSWHVCCTLQVTILPLLYLCIVCSYVYTHYVRSYLLYHKILIATTSDGEWKQYQLLKELHSEGKGWGGGIGETEEQEQEIVGVCYRRQMASQDETHIPACLAYRPKCRAAHTSFRTD